MTNPTPSPFAFVRTFNPVVTRARQDGWTPDKQGRFIEALAESACVADACRRVGVSRESAYALRRRYDATDFRLSWDAALDYAVQQLSDSALSRAIHGVPVPHYYKGEVVGEHRRYNESLTMFILRYRDPLRYARHWDRQEVVAGHAEQEAERLAMGLDNIAAGRSAAMYDKQNAVLRDAAGWATDEEARRLCDRQLSEGVAAAVSLAGEMLAARERDAEARERDAAARERDAEAAAQRTADARKAAAARAAAADTTGATGGDFTGATGADADADGDAFRFDAASDLSTSAGPAPQDAAPDPLDDRNYLDAPRSRRANGPADPERRGPSVRW